MELLRDLDFLGFHPLRQAAVFEERDFQNAALALKGLSVQKTPQKLLVPASHHGAACSWLLYEVRLSGARVQEELALAQVELVEENDLYDL